VGEPAGAAVVGAWLLVCGPSVVVPTVPVVAAGPVPAPVTAPLDAPAAAPLPAPLAPAPWANAGSDVLVTKAIIKNTNFLEALTSLLLKKQFRPIITVPHAVMQPQAGASPSQEKPAGRERRAVDRRQQDRWAASRSSNRAVPIRKRVEPPMQKPHQAATTISHKTVFCSAAAATVRI
jgi:hypothetical protein